MDGPMYKDIVNNIMLPHAKRTIPKEWIFQQDNDPKHTSKVASDFFTYTKIRVMPWPSQSLDLNPIEHQWEHLGRQMTDFRQANKREIFEKLKYC
jgi:DDE superfamily endonuclease